MKTPIPPQIILIGFLVIGFIFLLQGQGLACTLWAAAGQKTDGGGTIIAKNRDWLPDQIQKVELRRIGDGLQFVGLYAVTGKEAGLKAGVNEAGLTVVNAAAPGSGLHYHPHKPDLMTRLLSQCRDIDAVLTHRDWFYGARYLLLADRRRIAVIEIGPHGLYQLKTAASATLCHTNHYLEPRLRFFNPSPINRSSLVRHQFIQKYLNSQKRFSLQDFIKISRARQNGPDDSLWRTGGTPGAERTLATWIISQPAAGKGLLFVRTANPGQAVKESTYNLTQTFRNHALAPEPKRPFFFF